MVNKIIVRIANTFGLPLLFVSLLWPVSGLAQVAPVELVPVERRDVVETLRLSGSLTSPRNARLSPDVEGRLVRLNVDAGARVKFGDILFQLDDELARLELAQAVANEHEAEADLANGKRRVLEVRELVSKSTFPESEARNLEAQVQRFQAILERRSAERAFAAATLDRHSHRAPFSGVIARRDADIGERVDTGTTVFVLVSIDQLQLDLRVPQKYFGRVSVGTLVQIGLDALPDQMIETPVTTVVPVSDPDARTFTVRASIDNETARLVPGMSVSALLRIGTKRQAEVVPRDALIRYPDGRTTVWVAQVDDDRLIVNERLVKTGLGFDNVVEILEGLAEGERVVIRGNESLRRDQQVRIRE